MIPYKQLSLADIFSDCHEKFENDKPAFLSLLETHIDIDELIPISFRNHFYASTGRTRKDVYKRQGVICPLEGDYEPGRPECGFLFPAYVDGGADLNHVDIFQADVRKPHRELAEKILQVYLR